MKKRVAAVISYLLLTTILMWLVPLFMANVGLESHIYICVVLCVLAFTVQMIITYKMRCAWAWVWINAFYWFMCFMMIAILSGCDAIVIIPFVFNWFSLGGISSLSYEILIVMGLIYVVSFIVQLVLEYRRRKVEAADVAVIEEDAEKLEQDEQAMEKGVDK